MRILLIILMFSFDASSQCDTVNHVNKKIVELAGAKMGKKVLRGECWDLAKYVLEETNCDWDGLYEYGALLKSNDCVMPGDIIQFKNVRLKYKVGEVTFTELMTHHTAIVYEVKGEGDYVLIHQNTGRTGRKVGTSDFNVSDMIKGSIKIYRPVKS
jgi:hypothetical protein